MGTDWCSADRTCVVVLKPGLDALGMEVMIRIAGQWSDLFIVLEVTLADDAFSVLLELFWIEFSKHHLINDSISFILLRVTLRLVLPDVSNHARGATDAEQGHNCEHDGRPDRD